MTRVFWRGLWCSTIACLAASLAAWLGGLSWFLDLFSHFRPTYFVFLAASILPALAGRRWGLAGLCGLGLFVNGPALAPHWGAAPLRAAPDTATNHPAIHLATLNLYYRNRDHAAVEALLRKHRPDVVLLQEVTGAWKQALRGLSDIYPHQVFDQEVMRRFGSGVISRRKWTGAEIVPLGPASDDLGVAVHFAIGSRRVSIINVHNYHPTTAKEVRDLESYQNSVIQWAAGQASEAAVIVGGDFNCTPWSAHFRRFMGKSGLIDTSQGSVFGATWNVWSPLRILIDHFFVSDEWRLLRREIGGDVGSDHRPVFLDLALVGRPDD